MATYDFASFGGGDLVRVLNNSTEREALLRFAFQEFSVENVICILCIGQYRADPTYKKGTALYEVFLDGQKSPLEVNAPSSQCQTVQTQLLCYAHTQLKGSVARRPPISLFEPVTNTLMTNLSDTYSRFIFSFGSKRSWDWSKLKKTTTYSGQIADEMKNKKRHKLSEEQWKAFDTLEDGGFHLHEATWGAFSYIRR